MSEPSEREFLRGGVTYRELHEYCAGYGLEHIFFAISGIDADEVVECNCKWDQGHEPHCDIVLANKIIQERGARKEIER